MKDNKIVIMYPVNLLGAGGAERQLVELVKGIDKSRFKPIVVTLSPTDRFEEKEVKQTPGAELICVNRKSKYDFSTLMKIYSLLKQNNVDIIQPFLTPSTFFGILPAIFARTPIKIVTERSGVRVNIDLGYKTYLKIEDFLTRFADYVVPNSEAGKKLLVNRGINPERIKVIYNGINANRLISNDSKITQIREQMKLSPDEKVIGITATLSPAKDHATFLQGAKLIHDTMPQTRFALLGKGPLKQKLEDLARELGIESYVTFFNNQQEVGSYVSTFDVFCLTSIDHEGCSNATLEAMYLGKPVVVTDIGGNREIVEHGKTGFVIPFRNPEALANHVLKYLQDPELARVTGENARKAMISGFSLERMVHEYEEIYEEAIQKKNIKIKRNKVH